jgi:hypothetical protein
VGTLKSKIVAALQQERWKNGAALYPAHEKLSTQLRALAEQLERKFTARRRNGRSFHLSDHARKSSAMRLITRGA